MGLRMDERSYMTRRKLGNMTTPKTKTDETGGLTQNDSLRRQRLERVDKVDGGVNHRNSGIGELHSDRLQDYLMQLGVIAINNASLVRDISTRR
jgi:hypothetical protein